MSRIEALVKTYEGFVKLPWQTGLSGREKVWFCIYDPRDERRLRMHLPEFEIATKGAGHEWVIIDLTLSFENWMCVHEYRDSYFADPEYLGPALDDFVDDVSQTIRIRLREASDQTVVAILGVGALFGISRVSTVIDKISEDIRGRLLVFFPGAKRGNNYRLLDARDGWNYLAVAIEPEEK